MPKRKGKDNGFEVVVLGVTEAVACRSSASESRMDSNLIQQYGKGDAKDGAGAMVAGIRGKERLE